MLSTIQRFALFLAQYANLLLVLVTTVYVLLTWRNLRALRQASLREREARHLQEIKDYVIQPIVSWIRGTVFHRFRGNTPELLTLSGGYGGKPWELCHTVDDPFTAMRHLSTPSDPDVADPLSTWTSTESGRISKFLYDHAKRDHFRGELEQFDQLLEEVRQLTGTFVSFGNECAKKIGEKATIRSSQLDAAEANPEEIIPHQLVADCILSLLQTGQVPPIEVRDGGSDARLYQAYCASMKFAARGTQPDTLKHWCELGREEVRKGWQHGHLADEVRNVLRQAESVCGNIQGLLFTHSLGVDCELVSGRKRWR